MHARSYSRRYTGYVSTDIFIATKAKYQIGRQRSTTSGIYSKQTIMNTGSRLQRMGRFASDDKSN